MDNWTHNHRNVYVWADNLTIPLGVIDIFMSTQFAK